MPKSDKADSSPEAEKIFKDLRPLEQDQLSPHHDSHFSTFSTKVLIWKNRDTIVVVLPTLP